MRLFPILMHELSVFSYCGAQIFEIYGLGKEVVEFSFRGSASRIGGLTLDEVRILPNILDLSLDAIIIIINTSKPKGACTNIFSRSQNMCAFWVLCLELYFSFLDD